MKNTVSTKERKAFMAKFQKMVEHLQEVIDEVGEGRLQLIMWYMVKETHDEVWVRVWGAIDGSDETVSVTDTDLFTPWEWKDSILTLENLDKAEKRMEREIRAAMTDYDGFVKRYLNENEDETVA